MLVNGKHVPFKQGAVLYVVKDQNDKIIFESDSKAACKEFRNLNDPNLKKEKELPAFKISKGKDHPLLGTRVYRHKRKSKRDWVEK